MRALVAAAVLALTLATSPGSAGAVELDKLLHASVSASMAGAANLTLMAHSDLSPTVRVVAAAGASLTVGAIKELCDSQVDTGDLVADAVGAVVGALSAEYLGRRVWLRAAQHGAMIGVSLPY